jgi:signal peptidase I
MVMESVYVKLGVIFLALALVRALTFARVIPAKAREVMAQYADSGLLAAAVAVFVVTFLLQISRVDGVSMQPTLSSGEFALVDKLTYRWRAPQRGDIIVFRSPDDPRVDYIKRIIGLPGDKVEVRDGFVWVNGKPLVEPYVPSRMYYTFERQIVPEGSVFVLGDNRNRSYDSHLWDDPFLPMDRVQGRAGFIIWPPMKAGAITGKPQDVSVP